MIRLVPMTPGDFQVFVDRCNADYAAEKIQAGNWHPAEARQKAREENEKLLPAGMLTPGHHFFTIQDQDTGKNAGALWLAAQPDSAPPTGFIYELFIEKNFRRRGFATQAMLALEEKALDLGLEKLALHVFGHNRNAQALYTGLDYQITNINMAKQLKPRAD